MGDVRSGGLGVGVAGRPLAIVALPAAPGGRRESNERLAGSILSYAFPGPVYGVHFPYRVFYDVNEAGKTVTVKAVGWKEHNKLLIRGKEYQL